MIWGAIAKLIAPHLAYIMIGLAVAGGLTGLYFKIKHDGVVQERAKVEREKQDAINEVQKTKNSLRRACDSNPDQCVRDEWFRD